MNFILSLMESHFRVWNEISVMARTDDASIENKINNWEERQLQIDHQVSSGQLMKIMH